MSLLFSPPRQKPIIHNDQWGGPRARARYASRNNLLELGDASHDEIDREFGRYAMEAEAERESRIEKAFQEDVIGELGDELYTSDGGSDGDQ
jgi:hypothetical protein